MTRLIDVMIENREKYKRLDDINKEVENQLNINEKLIEEVEKIYTEIFKNCCNKGVFLHDNSLREYGLTKNGISQKAYVKGVRRSIADLARRMDTDWIKEVYPKLKELILENVKSNRKELIKKFLEYIPLLQLDWSNNINIRKEKKIVDKSIKIINFEEDMLVDELAIDKVVINISKLSENFVIYFNNNKQGFIVIELYDIKKIYLIDQVYDDFIELSEHALIEMREFVKSQMDIVEQMKKEFEPTMAIMKMG